MKVVVTARAFQEVEGPHRALLESQGFSVVYVPTRSPLSAEELAEWMDEEVVGVILGTDIVNRFVLERAPNLRVISRYGAGLDNLDLEALKERNIRVTYTPGANAISVAELTISLMLALARHLCWHVDVVRQGGWARKLGMESYGKTLGIVGMGRIGREVARRARGLGMRVFYHDPHPLPIEAEADLGVHRLELEELLSEADFVSLHLPLNRETRGMVDRTFLWKMKKGSFLINTSRGGLVNEEALYDALVSGHLAGAASDVFSKEPPEKSPLLAINTFLPTPHIGAYTREAVIRMGVMAVENLVAALKGERAPHGEVSWL